MKSIAHYAFIIISWRPYRDLVRVINQEFSWFVFIGIHPARQQVEEHLYKFQVLTSHIGHLEYRAYSATHTYSQSTIHSTLIQLIPLRREVERTSHDIVSPRHDHRYFTAAWWLEDPTQQWHCLLQHVRRTHVNLCYDNKDGNIERQRQTQVFYKHEGFTHHQKAQHFLVHQHNCFRKYKNNH